MAKFVYITMERGEICVYHKGTWRSVCISQWNMAKFVYITMEHGKVCVYHNEHGEVCVYHNGT